MINCSKFSKEARSTSYNRNTFVVRVAWNEIRIYLLFSIFVYRYTNCKIRTESGILGVSSNETSYMSENINELLFSKLKNESKSTYLTDNSNISLGCLIFCNETNNRGGYKKDLMVVLPVMQGNSNLSNSKLQMLYTKPPVIAIIGQDSNDLNKEDVRLTETSFLIKTTPKTMEKRIDYVTSEIIPVIKGNGDIHYQYAGILKKSNPITKAPLDYGYPESFKFVQILNELPKNHKPEWIYKDISQHDVERFTTGATTNDDPFQMFESVKPLEINKLLTFKQTNVPMTESIVEQTTFKFTHENTVEPYPFFKIPTSKRPPKKPEKIKLHPQKLSEVELAKYGPSTVPLTRAPVPTTTRTTKKTTTRPTTKKTTTKPTTRKTAIKTTTKFITEPVMTNVLVNLRTVKEEADLHNWTLHKTSETTTKLFLPTVSFPSKQVILENTTNEADSNGTNVKLNFYSMNSSTNIVTTQPSISETSDGEINPSDMFTLTKLLGDDFEPKNIMPVIPPPKELTTNSPFPSDMLSGDLNNMLIALGILKVENEPSIVHQSTTTTTTTTPNFFNDNHFLQNMLTQSERVTPSVDPNSFVMFKKIPVYNERQKDKIPVNDEMEDLLSSFGILPKKHFTDRNSVLIRMSRQYNIDRLNRTLFNEKKNIEKKSTRDYPYSESTAETPENLNLLQPLAYSSQERRKGHVFQPTVELEKLTDEQKVQKINDAIETIRKISTSKDVENLSIEELEKQLKNVTAFLKDENSADVNETTLSTDINQNINVALEEISTITTETTTELLGNTETVNDLENSTPSNLNDVTYKPIESAISLVKLVNNVSESSNESNLLPIDEVQDTTEDTLELQQSNDSLISSTSIPSTTSTMSTTSTTSIPSTTSTMSTTSTTSTTVFSTSTENTDLSIRLNENNNTPLPELGASFGGNNIVNNEPSVNDLPTSRPSGLYFYVDWNTFLNVGEGEKNPVRIRFSPRMGNPRHFLNIRVP
ncbi:hypothetical protein PGB90_009464 [Kerria lacca]